MSIFLTVCSWTQILETFPLPNVMIQFFYHNLSCKFNHNFSYISCIPSVLRYIFMYNLDQMDLSKCAKPTTISIWRISLHRVYVVFYIYRPHCKDYEYMKIEFITLDANIIRV